MANDLSLALRLSADTTRLQNGLRRGESGVRRFATAAKREFEMLKGLGDSLAAKLAGIGVGFAAVQQTMQSAQLDKSLTQIGQTAGATAAQVAGLRQELFTMSQRTGKSVEDLQQGFNSLVQSGMAWDAALETIRAVNVGMAVTGASADTLASGLNAAGVAFQFDLSKPGQAALLLDKMTVAGRAGNAELESLSDIFARVGGNAASAGMGFDQTLAFIEGLSKMEKEPERLATLADSTLRLFNNLSYMKDAAKTTGVRFFDAKGGRREALDIIEDMRAKYRLLKTDKERALFIQNAFGKADQDTQRGVKTLFTGNMIEDVRQIEQHLNNAGGALQKDLPGAINNAVDQVSRLKTALREAADGFAQRINQGLSRTIQWAMDEKQLSGGEMLGIGAGAAAGAVALGRLGKGLLGKLGNKLTGVGTGVAAGKALEAAAGVTPVYVVNMPDGGMGLPNLPSVPGLPKKGGGAGLASRLKLLGLGAAPLLARAGIVGAGAAAGWEVGSYANKQIDGTKFGDAIGRTLNQMVALFSQDSRDALAAERQAAQAERDRAQAFLTKAMERPVHLTSNIILDGHQIAQSINTVNGQQARRN